MLETTIDKPTQSEDKTVKGAAPRLEVISRPQRDGHMKARWIEAVSHLDPKYGGLSAAVPELSRAVAEEGRRALTLAGFCLPKEDYVPAAAREFAVTHLPLSRLEWLKHRRHAASLRQLLTDASGIHIHGLWQQSSAIAGPMARDLHKPYVISAHGMLESWAMAHKRWKKALYMSVSEGANLRGAACLHALTQAEAGDYRRIGLTNPVAVIPNGVTIPEHRSADDFWQEFPALRGKRVVLFLGRVHAKKGLDILCRAWAERRVDDDAHLVIAGPDFENTRQQIEDLVDSLHIRSSITFTGMLRGATKWGALAASTLFVLPSYSEGLSVAVLEAMGAGLPVLISEHCNLPEVNEHRCGWVIPAHVAALRAALGEALSASTSTLNELGTNGTVLVRERYSWPAIGRQMDALYSWLEGGKKPENVDLQFMGGGKR